MGMSAVRKKIFFGIAMCSMLIMSSSISSALELQPKRHPAHEELLHAAKEWREALITRNIDLLASYAFSIYREPVRNTLMNANSPLYKLFYNREWNKKRGSKSLYEILREANGIEVKFSYGANVYYLHKKLNYTIPASPNEHKEFTVLLKQGKILPVHFFKKEGKWYVNYKAFGEEF